MRNLLGWMEEHIVKRVHRLAHVETYDVTVDELESIERGYSSRQNDLAFLSISASIFASFLLTLTAVLSREPTPSWTSQFYWAVTVTSGLATAYFFCKWWRTARQEKSVFQRIRERSLGPLGEEGKELKPGELEQQPSEDPSQKRE
jgi:hypothetical protein